MMTTVMGLSFIVLLRSLFMSLVLEAFQLMQCYLHRRSKRLNKFKSRYLSSNQKEIGFNNFTISSLAATGGHTNVHVK